MASDGIRISVVVSSYNRVGLVGRTIDSVLAQSLPPSEVIVVDDGSTDGSVALIRKQFPKVKLIEQLNAGQGAAINAGYAASSGSIICFLDCDDVWESEYLSSINRLWQDGTAQAYVGLDWINIHGDRMTVAHERSLPPQLDLLREVTIGGGFPHQPTSANAFSRPYLERVMPMNEREWRTHPDIYLCFLAPLYGEVVRVPEPLCLIRKHDNLGSVRSGRRVSPTRLSRNLEVKIMARREVERHLSDLGYPALRRSLFDEAPFLRSMIQLASLDTSLALSLLPADVSVTTLRARLWRAIRSDPGMSVSRRLANSLWLLLSLLIVRALPLARSL